MEKEIDGIQMREVDIDKMIVNGKDVIGNIIIPDTLSDGTMSVTIIVNEKSTS